MADGAWLQGWLAERLGRDAAHIDPREDFSALGLDSLQSVNLALELEGRIGRALPATLVWDHPSIDALVRNLVGAADAEESSRAGALEDDEQALAGAVAIIGMGCRFPGGDDPEAFWELLRSGTDAVGEVPADRWDVEAVYGEDPTAPGRASTKWGGFLERVDGFDAEFFGISPREAQQMDPQQRLLLEVAWETLESAGARADELEGSTTGVFVGISSASRSMLMRRRVTATAWRRTA